MKESYKIHAYLLLLLFLLSAGCGQINNIEKKGEIFVIPEDAVILAGESLQFSAIGNSLIGQETSADITHLVSWGSSNKDVAVINSSGLATAVSPGIANITATFFLITNTGGNIKTIEMSGHSTLTVNAPDVELLTLEILPASVVINAGDTLQLSATGFYSDSTTRDMTSEVEWASSDETVLTVDAGLVNAMSAGSATVSVTDPLTGISSSDSGKNALVTVNDPVLTTTVVPFYPVNGADWNYYVSNNGADIFSSDGTACDSVNDGPGYDGCIHGGEMRAVVLEGRATCEGLTATDSLGAFDWTCVESGGEVIMVSTGLAEGKHLSDLIDFENVLWKVNSLAVSDSSGKFLTTAPIAWWDNPVVLNNDGSNGTDMSIGDIHIITQDPKATYSIGKSKVALVVKPGVTLSGTVVTGESLISAISKEFVWIEGDVECAGDRYGIYLSGSKFSAINNVTVANSNYAGLALEGSATKNKLNEIVAANNALYGIRINESSNNIASKLQVHGSGWDGIIVRQSFDVILSDVISEQNGAEGIDIMATSYLTSSRVTLKNALASNNGGSGVKLYLCRDNILTNITVSNNGEHGLYTYNSHSNSLSDITANNNAIYGVFLIHTTYNTMLNVVADNNASDGIRLSGATCSDNILMNVSVANNASGLVFNYCSNNNVTGLVLDSGTVTDLSYVGKLFVDDPSNGSDLDGWRAFNDIIDWTNFGNLYRGWGLDGSSFPHSSNKGVCAYGLSCRIWDWSLSSSDTVLRNTIDLPTGDDTLAHTWSDSSVSTLLPNAVEIMDDGIGNDNALCESGETCLYTPNIGAYQGHGSLVSAGYIGTGGTLSDITLLQFEFNGR